MKGFIHSIQSLGTVDGPGVRFVAFLSGCPLRCACCHNPDTWEAGRGQTYTPEELLAKAIRFREYFGKEGGVTLSGGEPLLQAEFCKEYFSLCKEEGLHTCLDTSGCLLTPSVKELLKVTDRVLLDIKYTNDDDYRRYVGCSLSAPLDFLSYLDSLGVATTLRQVIIPTLNDSEDGVAYLRSLRARYPSVDKIELLPFRKLCEVKYQAMGIPFPLADTAEPSPEKMAALRAVLQE